MSDTLRILFITGNSRSGSTFLGTALAQTPGIFCAGELQRIWDKDWLAEEFCSCGAPILRCPFWGPVFEDVIGTYESRQARAFQRARDRIVKVRNLPRLLHTDTLESVPADIRAYIDATKKLYYAIQRHSGCNLIIDTSKYPTYGYLLRLISDFSIRVVHLVRDPRAVAYSWKRVKRYPTASGEREMERHSLLRSAAAWNILNALARWLWKDDPRYLFMRYEDFVYDPRAAFHRILAHVDMADLQTPLSEANEIEIRDHHLIAGNANRFRRGKVAIRPDEEWRTALGALEQGVVTAATLPLLATFGYAPHTNGQGRTAHATAEIKAHSR